MNVFLFMTAAIIWGTTWLAIKFQLGQVDPMVSISYRFAIAAAALFAFSFITRKNLKYSLKDHLPFLLTGIFMFCLNYLVIYFAEVVLPSGLVAVSMTSMIFLNAVNNRIFLKSKIVAKTLLGGLLGILGLCLIFLQDIMSFSMEGTSGFALMLCMIGALSASLGNTAAQVVHRRKIPVIPMQAFSMMYGSLLMAIFAFIREVPFSIETTPKYLISLFYLAGFGSIVAFMAYLTLLKNIGSDKAAYTTLLSPLVALLVSTIFEGYVWTLTAFIGTALIIIGNVIALRKKAV